MKEYENIIPADVKNAVESAIRNGKNVAFMGGAGSGKSNFMLYLWDKLKDSKKAGFFSFNPEMELAGKLKQSDDFVSDNFLEFSEYVRNNDNLDFLFIDEYRGQTELLDVLDSLDKGCQIFFSNCFPDIMSKESDLKNLFKTKVYQYLLNGFEKNFENEAELQNKVNMIFDNCVAVNCIKDRHTGKFHKIIEE
jgi:hypothetical protein